MNKSNILIADDTSLIRQMLGSYVKALGYQNVAMARDGNDAVTLSKSKKIDIAFLDINMPKLDGLGALKKIKAHNPDVYVVMVSCASTLENIEVAMASGANGFIVKPFTPQNVIDALSNFEKMNTQTLAKQESLQVEFSLKVDERAAKRQKTVESRHKEKEEKKLQRSTK
jgi:two-component system chemotaxis response regulator CheY